MPEDHRLESPTTPLLDDPDSFDSPIFMYAPEFKFMPPPTYTEVSPRGWPLGFGERGFGEQRVLGWGPGVVRDGEERAWKHLNGLLASSPGGSLRRQQQRAVSAERKSLSHFFFWTLPLPWDLAAAQAGVFLGALLQERPREGRPVPRQLPGRLRGVRGKGVKCL